MHASQWRRNPQKPDRDFHDSDLQRLANMHYTAEAVLPAETADPPDAGGGQKTMGWDYRATPP